MKIKKKFDYAILSIVLLIGILIGYSPNFAKTKKFTRTHSPIGIDLMLNLSYLDDAIHYVLSINDFDKLKIEKHKFPYNNRIPIGIVRDSLPGNHTVTIYLQDKSGIAVLYRTDISVKSFLAHYCGCSIHYRGRIEKKDVTTDLKNLWKNINQFQIPSSFLYDRTKMFSEKLSF